MKIARRKQSEKRFRDRFKDYLKGKEEYLDDIRDRWTNKDIVVIFEYGIRLGKRRKK